MASPSLLSVLSPDLNFLIKKLVLLRACNSKEVIRPLPKFCRIRREPAILLLFSLAVVRFLYGFSFLLWTLSSAARFTVTSSFRHIMCYCLVHVYIGQHA